MRTANKCLKNETEFRHFGQKLKSYNYKHQEINVRSNMGHSVQNISSV